MADDLERRLAGLDGPRPLPPAVRARLEATVLATTSAPAPATPAGEPMPVHESPAERAEPLSTPVPLDSPRPLPSPLRARLEEAVLAAATAGPTSVAPAGPGARGVPEVPGARGVPEVPVPGGRGSTAPTATLRPGVRSRRSSARYVRALSAAAVLALVLGVVATLGDRIGPGQRDDGREVAVGGPSTATTGDLGTSTVPGDSATVTTATGAVDRTAPPSASTPGTSRPGLPANITTTPGQVGASSGPDTTSSSPAPVGHDSPGGPAASNRPEREDPPARSTGPDAGTEADSDDPGPAPPYARQGDDASDEAPAATASPAPPGRSQSPSGGPSRAPLRIGIVGGDPAQEAGFRAYVELLNRAGGVRHRAVELVAVGPGKPAGGVLATVNLSPRPISGNGGPPSWATGPVLETLTATEPVLTGRVFGFSSPPERQGHLVADVVFPQRAPGARAVIYRAADGPLADAVPRAIERVLAERGVKVTIEPYDPDKPPLLQPADAAFLSLEPGAARSFLRQAEETKYAPARGMAGVYSLFEPSLLTHLPEGSRVVSPYVVPPGEESEAIHHSAKGTGVGVLHGWATAKSLAVALWRSGAQTPDQVTSALEGLTDYDSGLAPPYEVRPGTHSRTPEGATHEVRSGAFSRTGGFRRDQY